jgi:DNA-binding SARP family transcriptional activator
MEIFLLGSVEVALDGVGLDLAGERQRGLVGVLALEKGNVIPTSRLLSVLWGDSPPLTARTKLQGLVSAFRRAIAQGSSRRHGAGPKAATEYLVTRPHGYELTADGVYVDAEAFNDMVQRARRAQHAGQHHAAAEFLEAALRLWRGPALADVRLPRLRGIAESIDERRLLAVAAKAEVDLTLGRADQVAAELSAWVNEYPLRERLRALLMQALCTCGCRADALHLYRAGREAIVSELGLEPGFELQRLHHRILADDLNGSFSGASPRGRSLTLTSGTRHGKRGC